MISRSGIPIKEPESILIVRFQDCDPFGHLNNAHYIDYFLNARQDQIDEHYGVQTYGTRETARASWVVKKTQIAYLRPVPAMSRVLVRTRLLYFDETSLVVEGMMLDGETRRLKALIWFDFAYVSLMTGKPTSHPDALMELFHSVAVSEGYEPNGFNRRVETARREVRRQEEPVSV